MAIPFSDLSGQTAPGTIQAPDDYQKVQASPNAFGAGIGGAMQQLGQGTEKLGGDLSSIAIQQQVFHDHINVTQALNAAQDSAQSIIFGDPNNPAAGPGYRNLRGADALKGQGAALQDLQDAFDQNKQILDDPRQQQMFDQQARRLFFSQRQMILEHGSQQQMQYGADTANATVRTNLNGAVLSYNDEDAFKNHMADALAGQRHLDDIKGSSPEERVVNEQGVMSAGWQQRIERLQVDDPLAANDMYRKLIKDNPGALLPAATDSLGRSLNAAVKGKEASGIGDSVTAVPGSGGGATRPNAIAPEKRDDILSQATQGTMVPKPLLNAMITQESGWDASAQRKGGSDFGLGQVTASTGADPGYGIAPLSRADAADPVKNATFAAKYLEARGKAAGLTSAADWQDPAKVAQALKSYNGGGDPNYVQNVMRNMPAGSYQEAKAGNTMNDASGLPIPAQTPADYYRDNYEAIIQNARDQAMKLHPEDPSFGDRAVSAAQQKMNVAMAGQRQAYAADENALWQAANGDLNKGIMPGTIEQLTASSPAAAAAWQRVQTQQPQLAHNIATRVLSQANSPDKDKDAATFGPAFYNTFRQIHAPDGSPNKITDPDQLYSLLGNGLTMSGVAKAREEIMSRRTPEGEAEAQMKTEFFRNAKSQISGADPTIGLKDPNGENNYLRFMAAAIPAIAAGKAKGLSAAQLMNPDDPNYVGKLIPNFARNAQQRLADMSTANSAFAPSKKPDAPGLFSRIFNHTAAAPDLSTQEGVRSAVSSGKMDREEGIKRLMLLNSSQGALPAAQRDTLQAAPEVPTND